MCFVFKKQNGKVKELVDSEMDLRSFSMEWMQREMALV